MRKIISVFALAFVLFGTASAQQKIGHVNSAEILQVMPEYKTMNEAVDKKKTEYSGVLEKMYHEYETKSKDIQDNGDKMMQAVLETKMKEVQDLQKRIQEFEQKAQTDLAKFAEEAMKPLNDKYLKAVKAVATENGFSYILDVAQGGVVYYPENSPNDVTTMVKTKMGISLTAVPAPKPGAGQPGGAPMKK